MFGWQPQGSLIQIANLFEAPKPEKPAAAGLSSAELDYIRRTVYGITDPPQAKPTPEPAALPPPAAPARVVVVSPVVIAARGGSVEITCRGAPAELGRLLQAHGYSEEQGILSRRGGVEDALGIGRELGAAGYDLWSSDSDLLGVLLAK